MPGTWRQHGRSATLVLVLLACLSTVAFGGGYRASRALLDDGAAWLVKGRSVALVNGDTGRPDAEVARDLATGTQALQVVRTGTGVYVVDKGTGTVTRIDTATMAPGATRPGPVSTRFVAGGGRTYVVDAQGGTAQEVDPTTLQPRSSVPVPGAVQSSVVGDDGTLWVLGKDGRLAQVRDGKVGRTDAAGAPGSTMTLVGGSPVVVDAAAATAVRWGRGGAEGAVDVLPLKGVHPEVAAPSAGAVLYLSVEGSGEVVAADLDGHRVRAGSLAVTPATDLGPPAVSRTRVAVPDLTAHRLLLLDKDLHVVGRVPVPATGDFSVTVQGDRFYATDPYRRTGVVVEADGSSHPLDKGEGHGVSEPAAPRAPTPARPRPVVAAPRPSRAPVQLPAPPVPLPAPAPAAPVTPVAPSASAPAPAAPAPTRSPAAAPVPVPDVVGKTKEQACADLAAVGLSCTLQPTGQAGAGAPGTVESTAPAAGTPVPAGSTVVVRHLGDTSVPNVVDQTVDQACATVEQAGLVCARAPDGQSAPQGQKAGIVLSQTPAAGQSAPGGSSVQVVHHSKVTPDSYVGRSDDEACAALKDLGLRCNRGDAGSNAGHPEPPGQVVSQDPPGGSAPLTPGNGVDSGDVVTVNRYTNTKRAVGTYTGGSPDQACAAAANDGFTCVKQVRHPYRRPDIAYAQDPAAGTQADGGAQVVVYYEDRAPTQLKRWKADGDSVWVISSDPARGVPAGYSDLGQTDLGMAFPPSPGGEGLVPIVAWQCTCAGHSPNHFYTTGQGPPAPWTSSGYAGFLFAGPQLPDEMQEVHRLVRVSGSTYDYAYAAAGSGTFSYYTGQGFSDDGALGWTWRS